MDVVRLIASLEKHEGYRANPYQCPAGKWTVGVGTNLEASPLTGSQWKRLCDAGHIAVQLSRGGADLLLRDHIAQVQSECSRAFADFWPVLNDVRQNVILEMAFQLGIEGVRQFKQTLFAIRSGQYEIAADRMMASKWATQTPKRAKTLADRMRSGVFA